MTPADWIILAAAVAVVAGSLAAWRIRKKKGKTAWRQPAQPEPPQPEPPAETVPKALLVPDLIALGVPEKLAPLMSANNVTPEELQAVVGKRGYFPEDMPIRDYPADFVEGCLVAAWPQVLQMVLDSRDLPF